MTFKRRVIKQDAGESLFGARQLEYIETTVYEKEYPETGFRRIFNLNTEGGPGIKFITYKLLDRTGTAQAMADAADDFPRVNVSMREFTAPVHSYGNSASWTIDEVDAAARNNMNLETMDAEAMRDAYERKCDAIADRGDPRTKLPGFNSNPNIPIIAPTTSAGPGDDTWPNKTADEIIEDFSLIMSTAVGQSMGTHVPTLAMMSPQRLMTLSTKRLSNTEGTLISFLQKAYPGLEFQGWQRMATAGVGGVQRLSVFQKRKDVCEFREPTPFELLPPERRGVKWVINGRGRIGGVIVRKPLAALHMDGI